jgi:hypothetical protein
MARRTPLSVEKVLAWADAHRARTGAWPSAASGRVRDASLETWGAVDQALRKGCARGCAGCRALGRWTGSSPSPQDDIRLISKKPCSTPPGVPGTW